MDVFEAMETCRAIRRLKPDPVPQDVLRKLVHYATRAPSAGNRQLWRFVVISDRSDLVFLGRVIRDGIAPVLPPLPDHEDGSSDARRTRAFREFALNFERVPAVIFTCAENGFPSFDAPDPLYMWASIYPATQNLILAARALGIGAAFTTMHVYAEAAIKQRFGIPEDVFVGATVPVGYPAGRYGSVTRRPAHEVTAWGRWDATGSRQSTVCGSSPHDDAR